MKKIILLVALLLTSCTTSNTSIIESYYKNYPDVVEISVKDSVMKCGVTKWQETLTIGSTRVTRTVKTECLNVYSVEIINQKGQFYDFTVAEYRLTDHKVNALVSGTKVILSKNESTTLVEYLKELNK
jgi:hypothetical protein